MILKRLIATVAIIAGVVVPASGLLTTTGATLADTPWGLNVVHTQTV